MLLLLSLAVSVWQYKAYRENVPLFVMLCALFLWVFSIFMIGLTPDPRLKLIWADFLQLASYAVPISLPIFAFRLAGWRKAGSAKAWWLLSLPFWALTAVLFTNQYHHLYWGETRLVGMSLLIERRIANYLANSFSYLLTFASFVLFIARFLKSEGLRRRQYGILIASTLIIWAFHLARILSIPLPFNIDHVIGLVFGGIVMYLGNVNFQLVGLLPAATAAIIDSSGEGLVVLDRFGFVADINATACSIFGVKDADSIKRRSSSVTDKFRLISETYRKSGECLLGPSDAGRWYEVKELTLKPSRRGLFRGIRQVGSVLVFRDMTDRKAAMEAFADAREIKAALREREALARELGGSAAQGFAAARLELLGLQERLAAGDLPGGIEALRRVSDSMQALQRQNQDSFLDLRQAAEEDVPLSVRFREFLERWTRERDGAGLILSFSPEEITQLDALGPRAEAQAIRVVQEALTNVHKHARARTADVRVYYNADKSWLNVSIKDDGVGFDLSADASSASGLSAMRERVAEAGGRLSLESEKGGGTCVIFRFPASS
jgi:signal transduction histidine kinase